MRGIYVLALLAAASAQQVFFLQSASEVATKEDLTTWLSSKEQGVLANIPSERQDFALRSVRKEYEQRLAELAANKTPKSASLPAFLFLQSARNCTSIDNLDAWKERQLTQVNQNVPAVYRSVCLQSIEQEYSKRVALLQANAGGCCFSIGFGDEMQPCCLKTWRVQNRAACPAKKLMGGRTGFKGGACPASAEEAAHESASVQLPQEVPAPTVPTLNLNAEEFKTEAELNAWMMQQMTQIDTFVPAGFRDIAKESVEKEFATRSEDLKASADLPAPATFATAPAPASQAMLLTSLALAALFITVSLIAAKRRRSQDGREPLLEHTQA